MEAVADRYCRAGLPAWPVSIDQTGLFYLDDHRVAGQIVVPAAEYVAAGLAVYQQAHRRPVRELEDLRFREALVIDSPDELTLSVTYDPTAFEYQVSSRSKEGLSRRRMHASGKLVRDVARPIHHMDLTAIRNRCTVSMSSEEIYSTLRRCGLWYGPYFQRIRSLWRRPGEVLAYIEPHEELRRQDTHTLHPTILDACFQSLAAALDDAGTKGISRPFLPVRIQSVRVYHRPAGSIHSHGILKSNTDRMIIGDIRLFDEAGALVAEIGSLRCLRARHPRKHAGFERDSRRTSSARRPIGAEE
jgi:hypothetical protein